MQNVLQTEIDHFAKDSSHWWDENGPFKPLHKLNPVRIAFIRDQILSHYGSIESRTILDIGCGGGLVCEPFARQGFQVSGIDADENAISVATAHAQRQDLEINYTCGLAEDLRQTYDVILALEVIEHVPDQEAFIQTCFSLCRPGGIIIFSTLNRTAKSYALGIIAAEYLLRWVPRGTHNWNQFVKPSEIAKYVRQQSGHVKNITGMRYHPLTDCFAMDPADVDVNYFLVAGTDTSASRK